jgi:hypothetical protein
MPLHECAQAQTLIQLAHQDQTAVGSHLRALELDPQRAVERELKGLFLRLTQWLPFSALSQSHPNPHPSGLFSLLIKLVVHSENRNPALFLFLLPPGGSRPLRSNLVAFRVPGKGDPVRCLRY